MTRKMDKSRRWLRIAAIAAAATMLAWGQDADRIRRPRQATICLAQPGATAGFDAFVLVRSSGPASFRTTGPFRMAAHLDLGDDEFCMEMDTASDRELANAPGMSYLFVPSIPMDGKPRTDLMLPLHAGVVLNYPDNKTLKGRKIVLRVVSIPESEGATIEGKQFWTASINGESAAIEKVEKLESELVVVLAQDPGNARKVNLAYKAKTPAEFTVTISTLGVPSSTKADPVGDSDVYIGFNFSRSKFSAKSPEDAYGLKLHASFQYLIPGHGKNLFSAQPQFDLLANAPNQVDDENSGKIYIPFVWKYLPGRDRDASPPNFPERTVLKTGPQFEGTKDFRITNFIYNTEFHVIPRIWIHELKKSPVLSRIRFDFDPQAGWEYGVNLHHYVAAINHQSINRFKAEGLARLTFEFNKKVRLSAIALQADYTYRYLFEPELVASSNSVTYPAGLLVPGDGSAPVNFPGGSLDAPINSRFDRGPRRYVDLSLRFIVDKNWEFVTGFARGELPPAYKHVDKLQTGVAFRFNLGNQ